MKKAFSLVEVIIAVVLISTVMFSLFQVNSNSINLMKKSNNSRQKSNILSMAFDDKIETKRNEDIYLEKKFLSINNDDLRKELKDKKVKVKSTVLSTNEVEAEDIKITITKFKTNYSFDDMKKDIYKFELEY